MVTKPLYDDCSGVLCLDFTNSLGRPAEGPWREHVDDYADLLLWSRQAGTLSEARARRLERVSRRRPEEAREVLQRAQELREAVCRVFSAFAHGKQPAPADVETINGELARALAHARVERTADGYDWGWDPAPDALEAPLWPVARSSAELLVSPDRERVRECAGHACLWLFLDRTKNRSRRWCDMKSCGNRAKVREHRRRKRELGGSA